MTWFETLTGFSEKSGDAVRSQLRLEGTRLTSLVNNRSFETGNFSTPSLDFFRHKLPYPDSNQRRIRIREVVADVQSLHQDPANKNSVFQVASQFNCLEMAAPHLTPEAGVGIYQNDFTQGPACCVCAGAGTLFRNYLVEQNGILGQTADLQIDCLSEIASHFDNSDKQFWRMQNGYCFPTDVGLQDIEQQLSVLSDEELNQLRSKLMVGLQSNTEITLGESNHRVTQVFCSALPVAYSGIRKSLWNHFPRLILDATYELAFYIGLENMINSGCRKLFLTLVGGGVFGNKLEWILSSIDRSLRLFQGSELEVSIVSYGSSNRFVAELASNHDNI